MIIKNNFNEKDVNPLSDYRSIGKNKLEDEYKKQDNVDEQVIQDIINKDHEFEEDDDNEKDRWSFFK